MIMIQTYLINYGKDFTIRPTNNHGEEQFTDKAISFDRGKNQLI